MIRIGDYYFDASLSESHTREANVTEFPIEDGSPISDHRQRLPATVTIEFLVSDTPIGEALARRRHEVAQDDAGGLLSLPILPSEEARIYLERLDDESQIVSLETKLRTYEDMVIVSLDLPVTPENDGVLTGTVVFTRFRIVKNRAVFVETGHPRGTKKRSLGTKQGRPHVTVLYRDEATDRLVYTDKDGDLWYATESGVPLRPMNREEITNMQDAEEGITPGIGQLGTGNVPKSPIPATELPSPLGGTGARRIGSPWSAGPAGGQGLPTGEN